MSQNQTDYMPGLHHNTVKGILREELPMRKINWKWRSQTLSSSQKAAQVQVLKNLLQVLGGRQIESCAIPTLDETWVYMDNP
jgi:hypothetical protein